ncbi:type III pantothenate kinase [Aequorivita sp. H23M31]|uniref:Type III pantothenate kinase n=1 Tax=Aequorivita ciconiae TaxID=2494375 RepID=A0A410G684_9FLAO|nr:type III pantothenate kinase [Aequorivita sp. H23M31]QAA82786.1 type III pantothenate kinase [Aequorivita sp. H23M31]
MNLVIDVGNTMVKLGVFDLQTLKLKHTCKKEDFLQVLSQVSQSFPDINNVLVATVGNFSENHSAELERRYRVLYLDQNTQVPFINNYATPHTLGVDRIAVVSAAAQQFPNKNVLVIDAGTCITYDFINADNEYLGGAISPGIALRYQALHSFTNKLPLLSAKHPDTVLGNSTEGSIHSGVVNGILNEIDGFIENYKNKYADLTVILTGGDTHFLRDSIKNDIFANSNFLLEGLNQILEYNIH